jgi:hypothetical protein
MVRTATLPTFVAAAKLKVRIAAEVLWPKLTDGGTTVTAIMVTGTAAEVLG